MSLYIYIYCLELVIYVLIIHVVVSIVQYWNLQLFSFCVYINHVHSTSHFGKIKHLQWNLTGLISVCLYVCL